MFEMTTTAILTQRMAEKKYYSACATSRQHGWLNELYKESSKDILKWTKERKPYTENYRQLRNSGTEQKYFHREEHTNWISNI